MMNSIYSSQAAVSKPPLDTRHSEPAAHSVQFYADDRFLLNAAARFLAHALTRGEAGVVIATQEHRRGIAEQLQARGIDVARARETDQYVEVDADEMLSNIMPEGRIDAVRFAGMLEDVIAEANAATGGKHRRAAVFGEAVSVLCARGEFEAAVELEQLWNGLAQMRSCILLCGHAANSLDRAAHAEFFSKICAQHSNVLPEESYLNLGNGRERLRYVAQLQQRARALETEMAARQHSDEALARSEKLAAVGRLTASIAHEINNPLTSLTNLFYLINTDPSLDPAARHYAALADQELRRTARITKQMLAFYRESATPIPCSLAPILDGVLELFEPLLRKNNIAVDKQYAIEGCVEAFPGEMRQLFANLIGNAIEAVGNRGKIRLRISCARDWTNSERYGVRVSIGDTGAGIAAEAQKHIFEPFFTTKGESGTGLGLWVCRGIVQKHEGRIRFRSRLPQGHRGGTVFSIFLPEGAEQRVTRQAAQEAERLDALGATG